MGRWEVGRFGGGRWEGGRWEGGRVGSGKVGGGKVVGVNGRATVTGKFDSIDWIVDPIRCPVFAVGWLGMLKEPLLNS